LEADVNRLEHCDKGSLGINSDNRHIAPSTVGGQRSEANAAYLRQLLSLHHPSKAPS
jgi:hypothetical protein